MNRKQKMMVAKDHLLSFLEARYGVTMENDFHYDYGYYLHDVCDLKGGHCILGDIYDARKSEDDWDNAINSVLGNVKERGRKYFQYTQK